MSADALLFELLDTVAQAFPRPPTSATIRVVPDANGLPALGDVEGTIDDDAPMRPNLGRDDQEILDALHQIVGDLGVVTQADAGFRIASGRIEIHCQQDNALEVWVIEDAHTGNTDDDNIRLKRRFDHSEQTWLVHTPRLFSRLNESEARENVMRESADAQIHEDLSVGLDLDSALCLFRHEVLAEEKSAPVQLIASYSIERGALLWGWANDVAPASVRNDVDTFRRDCDEVGLRAFIQAELACPIEMADRLARHAAVRMEAESVLTLPFSSEQGSGVIWVATTIPTFD